MTERPDAVDQSTFPTFAIDSGIPVTTNRPPQSIRERPRPLGDPIFPLPEPALAAMRYQSPLRYPGGKAALVRIIGRLIEASTQLLGKPGLLVEPFAGGSATALRLAGAGIVQRILLADADPLVARFWQVAAADTSWLIDRMREEPVTLERWEYWREWSPRKPNDRDVAVKCLFLNRTTFSGILHGRAGPIGGRAQSGAYQIGCRFNKASLERRLQFVGDLYLTNRLVDVWCKDWEATLADVAEHYPQLVPDRVVAYLDPPYLHKSKKLYSVSFDTLPGHAKSYTETDGWTMKGQQHYRLARYLQRRATYRWILSYDNEPELTSDTDLYGSNWMTPTSKDAALLGVKEWMVSKRVVNLRYTVAGPSNDKTELLLTTLPPSCVPIDDGLRPLELAGSPSPGPQRADHD
jgi:DNA adenine methylase